MDTPHTRRDTTPQPGVFVPHGAPTFALQPGAAGAALGRLASTLARPRAVIVASAHCTTSAPVVGASLRPQTVHDFWGFPQELYSIHYPATGCAQASDEVVQALRAAGFDAQSDPGLGLDHGAWIPLRLMYPDADVPVVPLSIQPRLGPEHHYRVGQALGELARQGFLVLGSGNLTHNLGDYQQAVAHSGATPAYVREFADWFWARIGERDIPSLLAYRRLAPGAVRAHPRDDHLLPFYIAMGAAPRDWRPERLHAGVADYVLAMDAFAFHPAAVAS
jgi:4,5-DOPA dioxygenase extradiol